jgi:hypothetical protein
MAFYRAKLRFITDNLKSLFYCLNCIHVFNLWQYILFISLNPTASPFNVPDVQDVILHLQSHQFYNFLLEKLR